jgi:hypothetical protein
MAKPFKSQFDLMAEAYSTISYKNQRLINEDKAGRRVIGYPPQLVTENSYEDAESVQPSDSHEEDDPLMHEKDVYKVLDGIVELYKQADRCIGRLDKLSTIEVMIDDDETSVGAAATNALMNLKDVLNRIV